MRKWVERGMLLESLSLGQAVGVPLLGSVGFCVSVSGAPPLRKCPITTTQAGRTRTCFHFVLLQSESYVCWDRARVGCACDLPALGFAIADEPSFP